MIENTPVPKGLLLDVDGTITNSKREVSQPTIDALLGLSQTDIVLGLCTGRHFATIKNAILPYFPADALHVMSGGGQLITSSGSVVEEHIVPDDDVRTIAQEVEKLGGAVVFGQNDVLYCSASVLNFYKNHPWKITARPREEATSAATPLLSVIRVNEGVKSYITSLTHLQPILIGASINTQHFDITLAGVNKATTAKTWAEKQTLSLDEVTAVGDGENDYELLMAVGHGVAMGHAPTKVQQAANEVIGKTDEDGLAIYLQTILRLKQSS